MTLQASRPQGKPQLSDIEVEHAREAGYTRKLEAAVSQWQEWYAKMVADALAASATR